MKTKALATARGKKLLKKMKGGPWKLCVWENLGWHFCVECFNGALTVRESDGKYRTLLASPGSAHSGSYDWRSDGSYIDPNKAVAAQMAIAKQYVRTVHDWVTSVDLHIR